MTVRDLGTFEGFNFREQAAIGRALTAGEVIAWDHDAEGEAQFWPAGDCAGVSAFVNGRISITARELVLLDELLDAVNGNDEDILLALHVLVNVHGEDLDDVTATNILDLDLHIFTGTSFIDMRREAAFELFELYWPELHALWKTTPLDGLNFDTDRFLDSPTWETDELNLGHTKALLVMAR